nr:PP1a [Serpentovirales sp.]
MVIITPEVIGKIPRPVCSVEDIKAYNIEDSIHNAKRRVHPPPKCTKLLVPIQTSRTSYPKIRIEKNYLKSFLDQVDTYKKYLKEDNEWFPGSYCKKFDSKVINRYTNPLTYKYDMYEISDGDSQLNHPEGFVPTNEECALTCPNEQGLNFAVNTFSGKLQDFDLLSSSYQRPIQLTDSEFRYVCSNSPKSEVPFGTSPCMQLVSCFIETLIQVISHQGVNLSKHRINLANNVPQTICALNAALPEWLTTHSHNKIEGTCIIIYRTEHGVLHANIVNKSQRGLRIFDTKEFQTTHYEIVAIYQLCLALDENTLVDESGEFIKSEVIFNQHHIYNNRLIQADYSNGYFNLGVRPENHLYKIKIDSLIRVHSVIFCDDVNYVNWFDQSEKSSGRLYLPYHRIHYTDSFDYNFHSILPAIAKATIQSRDTICKQHSVICVNIIYGKTCQSCQMQWLKLAGTVDSESTVTPQKLNTALKFVHFCQQCCKMHKRCDCQFPLDYSAFNKLRTVQPDAPKLQPVGVQCNYNYEEVSTGNISYHNVNAITMLHLTESLASLPLFVDEWCWGKKKNQPPKKLLVKQETKVPVVDFDKVWEGVPFTDFSVGTKTNQSTDPPPAKVFKPRTDIPVIKGRDPDPHEREFDSYYNMTDDYDPEEEKDAYEKRLKKIKFLQQAQELGLAKNTSGAKTPIQEFLESKRFQVRGDLPIQVKPKEQRQQQQRGKKSLVGGGRSNFKPNPTKKATAFGEIKYTKVTLDDTIFYTSNGIEIIIQCAESVIADFNIEADQIQLGEESVPRNKYPLAKIKTNQDWEKSFKNLIQLTSDFNKDVMCYMAAFVDGRVVVCHPSCENDLQPKAYSPMPETINRQQIIAQYVTLEQFHCLQAIYCADTEDSPDISDAEWASENGSDLIEQLLPFEDSDYDEDESDYYEEDEENIVDLHGVTTTPSGEKVVKFGIINEGYESSNSGNQQLNLTECIELPPLSPITFKATCSTEPLPLEGFEEVYEWVLNTNKALELEPQPVNNIELQSTTSKSSGNNCPRLSSVVISKPITSKAGDDESSDGSDCFKAYERHILTAPNHLATGFGGDLKIDFSNIQSCQDVFSLLRARDDLVEVDFKFSIPPYIFYAIVNVRDHFAVYGSMSNSDLLGVAGKRAHIYECETQAIFVLKQKNILGLNYEELTVEQRKRFDDFVKGGFEDYIRAEMSEEQGTTDTGGTYVTKLTLEQICQTTKYQELREVLQYYILMGSIEVDCLSTHVQTQRFNYETTIAPEVYDQVDVDNWPFDMLDAYKQVSSNQWFAANCDGEGYCITKYCIILNDLIITEHGIQTVRDLLPDEVLISPIMIQYTEESGALYRWEVTPIMDTTTTVVDHNINDQRLHSLIKLYTWLYAKNIFVKGQVQTTARVTQLQFLSGTTFQLLERSTSCYSFVEPRELVSDSSFFGAVGYLNADQLVEFRKLWEKRGQSLKISDQIVLWNKLVDIKYECDLRNGLRFNESDYNHPPQPEDVKILGAGAFGVVCRKNNHIYKCQAIDRGSYEAKVINRIHQFHANSLSVKVLGQYISGDSHYMELTRGPRNTLWNFLHNHQKFEERLPVIKSVYYELKRLSAVGVAHNDLHSENILVSSKESRIMVIDFGLAITSDFYIPEVIESTNAVWFCRFLLQTVYNVDCNYIDLGRFHNRPVVTSIDGVFDIPPFRDNEDMQKLKQDLQQTHFTSESINFDNTRHVIESPNVSVESPAPRAPQVVYEVRVQATPQQLSGDAVFDAPSVQPRVCTPVSTSNEVASSVTLAEVESGTDQVALLSDNEGSNYQQCSNPIQTLKESIVAQVSHESQHSHEVIKVRSTDKVCETDDSTLVGVKLEGKCQESTEQVACGSCCEMEVQTESFSRETQNLNVESITKLDGSYVLVDSPVVLTECVGEGVKSVQQQVHGQLNEQESKLLTQSIQELKQLADDVNKDFEQCVIAHSNEVIETIDNTTRLQQNQKQLSPVSTISNWEDLDQRSVAGGVIVSVPSTEPSTIKYTFKDKLFKCLDIYYEWRFQATQQKNKDLRAVATEKSAQTPSQSFERIVATAIFTGGKGKNRDVCFFRNILKAIADSVSGDYIKACQFITFYKAKYPALTRSLVSHCEHHLKTVSVQLATSSSDLSSTQHLGELNSQVFNQLKFQTTKRKIACFTNSCYVHAAAAVWAFDNKYLTLSGEKLLQYYSSQQGDASELLSSTGYPLITNLCNKHAQVSDCVNDCSTCLLSVVDGTIQIFGDHNKCINFKNTKLQPKAWLYYSGNGLSGHWFCITEEQGIYYMYDSARRTQISKRPYNAIYTICDLTTTVNVEEHDITECSGDWTVITNDVSGVVSRYECLFKKLNFNTKQRVAGNGVFLQHDAKKSQFKFYCTSLTDNIYTLRECNIFLEVACDIARIHHSNKVWTTKIDKTVVYKTKPKVGRSAKWRLGLRRAVTDFCLGSCWAKKSNKVLYNIGCGVGKDIPHLKALGSIDELYASDISQENTKQFEKMYGKCQAVCCDLNCAESHEIMGLVDLSVSFFAWHFHNKPEEHCPQLHILPYYNPETYAEWDRVATTTVYTQDHEHVYHRIVVDTMDTTEILYTKDYWMRKFNCNGVKFHQLADYVQPELTHPHHANFLVIEHGESCNLCHKALEPVQEEYESGDNESDNYFTTNEIPDSQETGSLESDDVESIDLNTVEVEVPIRTLTMHSSDVKHLGHHHGYLLLQSTKGADFCMFDDCHCCMYSCGGNIPTKQVMDNMYEYNSQVGSTLNLTCNQFFDNLHTHERVYVENLVKDGYNLTTQWLIYQKKQVHKRVIYISETASASPSGSAINIARISEQFDVVYSKRVDIEPNVREIFVWCGSQDECLVIVNQALSQGIKNISTIDFRLAKGDPDDWSYYPCYQIKDTTNPQLIEFESETWSQWLMRQLVGSSGKQWTCVYGETVEQVPQSVDRCSFVSDFIEKHRLFQLNHFDTIDTTYFFKATINNDLPKNLEGCFTGFRVRRGESRGRDDFYVASTTVVTDSKVYIASLVYKKNGFALYLNGNKVPVALKRGTQLSNAITDLLGCEVKSISEYSIVHYESVDYQWNPWLFLWYLPMLFVPNLVFFACCTIMFGVSTFKFKTSFSIKPTATLLLEKVVQQIAPRARLFTVAHVRSFVKWGSILSLWFIGYTIISCLVYNYDLVDTSKPSQHSIFKTILSWFGLIPDITQYRSAITLKSLCGYNPICVWGRPSNKHYLDDYYEYTSSSKGRTIKDLIIIIGSYLPPWAWILFFLGVRSSVSLVVYNTCITAMCFGIYYAKYYRCCTRGGPSCPRHFSARSPNMAYTVDGRNYMIPILKTDFCNIHNFWCNSTRTHIMPKPIARTIEDTYNIKKGSIKTDAYYRFNVCENPTRLPTEEREYCPEKTYDVSHLDYAVWSTRVALFAHRTGRVVNLAALPYGDFNTNKVCMTRSLLNYFSNTKHSNYVKNVEAGDHNNLHCKFYSKLEQEELSELENFCYHNNQTFTLTCINKDNFLSGKLPSEFDIPGAIQYDFHQSVIELDQINVKLHDDIRAQACEYGYQCSNARTKFSTSRPWLAYGIFGLLMVITLCSLTSSLMFKVKKRGYYAGLNPSHFDYCKGPLYIQQETTGAEPVSLSGIVKYQAWLYPNGTYAFTESRVSHSQRSDCGVIEQRFYARDHALECGKRIPTTIAFSLFSIFIMETTGTYLTSYGEFEAEVPTTCVGFGGELMCHGHFIFMQPSTFIFFSSTLLCCIAGFLYLFIRLHAYFGKFTADMLCLLFIHIGVCGTYLIHPLFSFIVLGVILFLPLPIMKLCLWAYVCCVGAFLCGVQVLFVVVVYGAVLVAYWFYNRNPTGGVTYSGDGIVFGSDYTSIATSSFICQPDSVHKVLNATGLSFEKLLEFSRGPAMRPECALATKLLHAQMHGTSSLYEPPVKKVPVFLQSAFNRMNETLMSKFSLNSVCTFQLRQLDGSTQMIGHGVYINANTVITARHVYGDTTTNEGVEVLYNGVIYKIIKHEEVGFNSKVFTVPTGAREIKLQDHHELQQGYSYTQLSLLNCADDSSCRLYPLVPSASGHFANATTFAGESGSPIFFGTVLVGIHQGTVNHSVFSNVTNGHAIATRIDGTPFDPKFSDVLKTVGDLVYDGNTILETFIHNMKPGRVARDVYLEQIAKFNKAAEQVNYISNVDAPRLLQGEAYDISNLIKTIESRVPIKKTDYQACHTGGSVELQASKFTRTYLNFSCPTVMSLCLAVFNFIFMLRNDELNLVVICQLLFSVAAVTTLVRNRLALCTVIMAPWFCNIVLNYVSLFQQNLDIILTTSEPILYLTAIRFYLQDFCLFVVCLGFFILKCCVMPMRQLFFTVGFLIGVLCFGGLDANTIAIYFVCASFPSSFFTFACIAFANSQYVVLWYVINFILSLRINYPIVLINFYRHFTADVVIISKIYLSTFTTAHGRLPNYWECIFSILYYSDNRGQVEFLPQSRFLQSKVLGLHTSSTNIKVQSKALMDKDKVDERFAFFIQACEPFLQSTAAGHSDFVAWVQTVASVGELERWLEHNPNPDNDKSKKKNINIVSARIQYLKAKEQALLKQLNLLHQEQVRGLIRSEQASKLAQLVDRAILDMKEKYALSHRKFCTGVIAASTSYVPELLVITNISAKDNILWDDEVDSFVLEADGDVWHFNSVKTNDGVEVTTLVELESLPASAYPLSAKIIRPGAELQANVGYSTDTRDIELVIVDGRVTEVHHRGVCQLKSAAAVSEGSVYLPTEGGLKPFDPCVTITPAVLAAVITKLNQYKVELQSKAIRIGGVANTTKHCAISQSPVRCDGFITYWGSSICSRCKNSIPHDCQWKGFIQVPSACGDPSHYLDSHVVCQEHNQFTCGCTRLQAAGTSVVSKSLRHRLQKLQEAKN